MYLPELLEAAGIRNVVLGRLYYPAVRCGSIASSMPPTHRNIPIINRSATAGRRSPRRPPCAKRSATSGGRTRRAAILGLFGESIRLIIRGSNDLSNGCVSTAPNAGACVAWQMTWAYGSGSDHGAFLEVRQRSADVCGRRRRRAARDGGVRDRNGDSHRYGDPEPAGGRVQQSAVRISRATATISISAAAVIRRPARGSRRSWRPVCAPISEAIRSVPIRRDILQ